jgi:hypothetical protein
MLEGVLVLLSCTNMVSPSRIFPLAIFTFPDFLKHMFPHIPQKFPRGLHMRPTGCIELVSDSRSTASMLSAVQSFATCSRNLYTSILLQYIMAHNLLTYSRSWALLEESPIVQPLKNFSAFYGIRRFNTVFTTALH